MRRSTIGVAVAFVLLGSWVQAGSSGMAVDLHANMSLTEFNRNIFPIYKKKQRPGDPLQRINTRLPRVMVYDPSGALIYYGVDAAQNASLLKSLPQSAKGLSKVDGLF